MNGSIKNLTNLNGQVVSDHKRSTEQAKKLREREHVSDLLVDSQVKILHDSAGGIKKGMCGVIVEIYCHDPDRYTVEFP